MHNHELVIIFHFPNTSLLIAAGYRVLYSVPTKTVNSLHVYPSLNWRGTRKTANSRTQRFSREFPQQMFTHNYQRWGRWGGCSCSHNSPLPILPNCNRPYNSRSLCMRRTHLDWHGSLLPPRGIAPFIRISLFRRVYYRQRCPWRTYGFFHMHKLSGSQGPMSVRN